jgi:hypothetical protein
MYMALSRRATRLEYFLDEDGLVSSPIVEDEYHRRFMTTTMAHYDYRATRQTNVQEFHPRASRLVGYGLPA